MKTYYIDKCLEFEGAYLDYPFDEADWAAIRHKENSKIFALIYHRNNKGDDKECYPNVVKYHILFFCKR